MDELNINNILKKYKATIYDIINTKKNNYINARIKKIFIINLEDNIIRRNYILILMKKFNINFSLVVVTRINEKIYSQVGNKQITKDELGCTLSHLWCLNEIIKNKYENAIIFEDDVIFHKNFKEMFMNIFHHEYDFLLLGACDFSFKTLNKDRLINNDDTEQEIVKIQKKKELHIIHSSNADGVQSLNFGSLQNDKNTDNEKATELSYPTPVSDRAKVAYKNVYRPHINSEKVYGAHANYYSLEGAKAMFDYKREKISFFDKDYMQMFDKFQNSSFICYPNLVISDISTSNLHHIYEFFSKSETLYYLNCFDNFSFADYNVIYLDIILKHKGVKIKENDTYESYITRLIKYQFSCAKERDIIKNRFVLDFFTIFDLEKIRFNI